MKVTITNGTGSAQLKSGNYTVTSNTKGYDNSTINPSTLNVDKTTGEYSFTIASTGTLTLHVTETGESTGVAVVGAKFKRCDKDGNEYGSEIVSDASGNAVFNNLPFDTDAAVNVYYKQTASDDTHEFDNTLKTIQLTSSTTTVEVTNAAAITRTIKLVDANYSNLPIESGELNIN